MKIRVTYNVNMIDDIIKYELQDAGMVWREFTDDVYTTRNLIHDSHRSYKVSGHTFQNFNPRMQVLSDIGDKMGMVYDFFALRNRFDVMFNDL